jgi:hypothetical protein
MAGADPRASAAAECPEHVSAAKVIREAANFCVWMHSGHPRLVRTIATFCLNKDDVILVRKADLCPQLPHVEHFPMRGRSFIDLQFAKLLGLARWLPEQTQSSSTYC